MGAGEAWGMFVKLTFELGRIGANGRRDHLAKPKRPNAPLHPTMNMATALTAK